jgi:xylulose-5-phosphate/fructose-6-phosphate phosphoketolase
VIAWCESELARHQIYIREHFEDLPEVRDWKWSEQ